MPLIRLFFRDIWADYEISAGRVMRIWFGSVRFGYTAASALRYGLCLIEPFVSIATDEGAQAFWTEELGCTLYELFEGQVMTRALWGQLTEEARRLIDRVGDRG